MALGTLYLIPTPLGDGDTPWLPEGERARVTHLTHFVVEAEKTARKHLKQLGVTTPIRELVMHTLNEHTKPADVAALLAPLAAGQDLGLVSEAGCPAVADPGAQLVALAHEKGYRVEPLIGPSSILLAMMASGANGQCFADNHFGRSLANMNDVHLPSKLFLQFYGAHQSVPFIIRIENKLNSVFQQFFTGGIEGNFGGSIGCFADTDK